MQVLFILFCLLVGYAKSFLMASFDRTSAAAAAQKQSLLFLVEDDQDILFGSSTLDGTSGSQTDASLYESLKERKRALKHGIGKRYITRTQKGFLNVHFEPSDPFDTENVVSTLSEGQIVTSTGPSRGSWIPHDGGGWSVGKLNGFVWLEPIDE